MGREMGITRTKIERKDCAGYYFFFYTKTYKSFNLFGNFPNDKVPVPFKVFLCGHENFADQVVDQKSNAAPTDLRLTTRFETEF